jgi:hypothetical protein
MVNDVVSPTMWPTPADVPGEVTPSYLGAREGAR